MHSQLAGANIFVLFDTSNYMYRGFVFAQCRSKSPHSPSLKQIEGGPGLAFETWDAPNGSPHAA
jgi:hypothetical protein